MRSLLRRLVELFARDDARGMNETHEAFLQRQGWG